MKTINLSMEEAKKLGIYDSNDLAAYNKLQSNINKANGISPVSYTADDDGMPSPHLVKKIDDQNKSEEEFRKLKDPNYHWEQVKKNL